WTHLDRVGEWQGSCEDCGEDRQVGVERLAHRIAKDCRADFHRADFIDHDKPPRMDRFADRLDAHCFERGKIEPVFPDALGRCEIDMREYSFIPVERHDLESDPRAMFADLLGIKTTGALRQLLQNTLDQRRLARAGTTGEQNFLAHGEKSHQMPRASRWRLNVPPS